jgi:hypothetical protein
MKRIGFDKRLAGITLFVVAIGCAMNIFAPFKPAFATPQFMFNSTTLAKVLFAEDIDIKSNNSDGHQVEIRTKGASDVYYIDNKVAPTGNSGWHTHPGPSVVAVKAGVAAVYDGDDPTCTPHYYAAGTGFADPGFGHVHMVRNESSVTLELVAFQIIPAGAARRIDAPSPGNCPF